LKKNRQNNAVNFQQLFPPMINEFNSCFHQFVSRFFPTNFSQFEQLKKKTGFVINPKTVFFLSFPVEKEIMTNFR